MPQPWFIEQEGLSISEAALELFFLKFILKALLVSAGCAAVAAMVLIVLLCLAQVSAARKSTARGNHPSKALQGFVPWATGLWPADSAAARTIRDGDLSPPRANLTERSMGWTTLRR
jgi:hypothetical protein